MKTLIATLLAALIFLGPVVDSSVDEVSAHPRNTETLNICKWWDAYFFGPENNGVYISAYQEQHWWGSHQVVCVYSIGWTLLYDRVKGNWAWIH